MIVLLHSQEGTPVGAWTFTDGDSLPEPVQYSSLSAMDEALEILNRRPAGRGCSWPEYMGFMADWHITLFTRFVLPDGADFKIEGLARYAA